jgi:hypothetical protein
MPNIDTISTFGGYSCVNPRSLSAPGAYGKRSAIYERRANSFRCPTGDAYGVGYCLLYGKDYARIRQGSPTSFTMRVGTASGNETKTFPYVYPVRGTCVVPDNDPNKSVYLLEFVDRRYFLSKFSSCNIAYNVRCPGTSYGESAATDFYANSLNDGTLWDWKGVITNLMSILGINATNALGTGEIPTSVPENLSFRGVRTWAALQSVLTQVGGELSYNPSTDEFQVINAARASSTDESLTSRLLYDYDITEMNGIHIPEAFDVCYRRVEKHAGCESDMNRDINITGQPLAEPWEMHAVHVIRIQSASFTFGDVLRTIPGTVEPIWSSTPAIAKSDDELLVSLTSDANSLVQAAIRTRLGRTFTQRKVYNGLPASVIPNSANKIVVWRDYGDSIGIVTESMAPDTSTLQSVVAAPDCEMPDAALAPVKEWAAPPDFARHTKPSYPRGLSILSWGEGEMPEEGDEIDYTSKTYGQPTLKQYADGRIIMLDPSDKESLLWNTSHDQLFGQECYLVVPNFLTVGMPFHKGASTGGIRFPIGQTFFGKLQGVADDGKPIFVIHHFHDFVTGYLKEGETLTATTTAVAFGNDGLEYRVSGRFLDDDKQFESLEANDIYLGWHADPTEVDNNHYWKVIVAKKCPTTYTPE